MLQVTIEHARSRKGRGGGGGGGGSGDGGMGRFSPRFSSYRQSRSSGPSYGPPVRTEHRLIVENLSSRISWQVKIGSTGLWSQPITAHGQGERESGGSRVRAGRVDSMKDEERGEPERTREV
ncbi:uncharacterized protein ACN63O_001603 [Diretmus argenteus]